MTPNMTGKICLVTGASSGIGREAVKDLAAMGSSVVMVCRHPKLGEKIRNDLVGTTGNENIELMICDLSSQAQIRALASSFKTRYDKLHVLVNNAATVPARRILTEDGIEMQLAVNHLAYFLLTELLLDVLRAGAPARIVNVASGMHRSAVLDFDDLQAAAAYRPMKQYAVTKLLNIFHAYELARRLEGSGVTVNALSPGFTATRINREFSAMTRLIVRILAKNVRRGARTVTFVASSPELEGISGRYFEDCREGATSPQTSDCDLASRVWAESAKLVDKASPPA